MKLIKSIGAFLLDYFSLLLLRKLQIAPLQVAARSFLFGAVSVAALPPLVESVVAAVGLYLDGEELSVSAVLENMGGGDTATIALFVLAACSVTFFLLSHFLHTPKTEDLVSKKKILGEYKFGNAVVHCYVGDISYISEADLVVTSEDTDLDLGSMSGTSVSGRIRRITAEMGCDGDVITDNLQNSLNDWKDQQRKRVNFALGTTVVIDEVFEASRNNIKKIVLGVAVRKGEHGVCTIQTAAISKIIERSISEVEQGGLRSVFFPVFGLGSGGVKTQAAVRATVEGLLACLGEAEIKVYLGVYKKEHQLALMAELQKECLKL